MRLRTLSLVALFGLAWAAIGDCAPPGGQSGGPPSPPSFSRFAHRWQRHGLTVEIARDGRLTATWRTYRFCSEASPPCDSVQGDVITEGGRGTGLLRRVSGATASGQVTSTNDASTWPPGPLSITLREYDTARIQLGQRTLTVCGPAFARTAPAEVIDKAPCGA
jgi:hypothetical protein